MACWRLRGGAVAALASGFDEVQWRPGWLCGLLGWGGAVVPASCHEQERPRATIIKTLPKTERDMMRILRERGLPRYCDAIWEQGL